MGAQQSRKLNFPAGSVETKHFLASVITQHSLFGSRDIQVTYFTFMVEPNSTIWILRKRYEITSNKQLKHIQTLGFRVSDLYVENDSTLYILWDLLKNSETSALKPGVWNMKKYRNGLILDNDGDSYTPLSEPLANPLKHPWLDVLNEFLVKKADPAKIEV